MDDPTTVNVGREGTLFEMGRADYEKVSIRQYISDHIIVGLHAAELTKFYAEEVHAMVMQLNAYVLTEGAGDSIVDYIKVMLPLRPWWIPKFLWRRIPTFQAKWLLEVEPRWRYPEAPEHHPLGRPVEYVKSTRNWRPW